MKKIKAQSIILLVILLAGLVCLTGMASADEEYSISYDTGSAFTANHGAPSPITLADNTPVTISTQGTYILQQGDFSNVTIRITVPNVILVLNGTNITNPVTSNQNTTPLQLMPGSNVTLVLMDDSENSFICKGTSGIDYNRQAGIFVDPTAELTIRGQNDNSGKLTAIGGYFSAGIGGGPNGHPGKITIEGGNITAESNSDTNGGQRNGAGIGAGGGNSSRANDSTNEIIIRGEANVTASGKGNGAGIGGGGSNNNTAGESGTIKIYGNATVTAISENQGAGIGGGGTAGHHASILTAGGAGGIIEIYGNANVTATGSI